MGEVYRADDMKLGQPVALKFLPPSLDADPDRRQRLLDEVRLARQVAHPNVCHVWDIGEVDGHDFLAMEYVDGEDLASLLRRIGRLPEDRAVRMARELCAGLAAAHDEGILHRDLKPANVMVDGRGRVKLADFGLAAVAANLEGTDVRSGTPAYMSPEQLAGREVTVRSDVYALGLVLYEIFTGRVAFPAKTLAEAAERSETPLSSPSSYVEGLDPAIERAIERCLETDPALRPASATAVAASLPGGDPLAAALAAGETPSPELVAAAGGAGGLRLPVALAALAAIAGGIALTAWLADRSTPYLIGLEKPPEVLAHEAQQILLEHGAAPQPTDRTFGFVVEKLSGGSSRLLFWYRQSPRSLVADAAIGAGDPSFDNPPAARPGMAGAKLDTDGRLVEFVRVPEAAGVTADGPGPGLSSLLTRTGLDTDRLQPAEPEAIPPVFADTRVAWTSPSSDPPVRVEAASLEGWPVWLVVRREGAVELEATPSGPGQDIYLFFAILVLAAIVARRNLRLERSDRVGARRVGALGAFVSVVGFGLLGPAGGLEPAVVFLGVSISLFFAMTFWLTYLALEPMVRRRWPHTLASWTRLLSGRFLDPLLGRDLLLGVVGGVALGLTELVGRLLTTIDSGGQWSIPPDQLLGGWAAAGGVVRSLNSVLGAFMALLLLAVLRQLLRSTWAAALVTLALTSILFGGSLENPSALAMSLIFPAVFLGLLIRLGLLAAATAFMVHQLLAHTYMTTHLTAWYADSAVAGILTTVALAGWGFYAATARSLRAAQETRAR